MAQEPSSECLLAVIVINYRTPKTTIECLQSVLPQLNPLAASVIIVDNNSGDDSIERIAAWIDEQPAKPSMRLIKSDFNGGFAAGNNLAIQSCLANYYLLLNSDTLLHEDVIDKLLVTATEYPAVGLVSPRLEFKNGQPQPSCFNFHSPISEFCRAAQTGLLDRLFRRYRVTLPLQATISMPQWTSFACVLLKREVLDSVGLLDPEYFMYFEDSDYCLRASRAGWKIAHNPSARVVHLRGGSSSLKRDIASKQRLPRYYYESRARYFHRLRGWPGLTAANLCWNFGRVISFCRQQLGRADKAVIDGEWRDIWINWLTPLRKYSHPGLSKR